MTAPVPMPARRRGLLRRAAALWLSLTLAALATATTPAQAQSRVQRVISPGGIEAWLIRDDSLPVMAMEFLFSDAGARADPAGKGGLAAMAAALLDEGAGDLDSRAFRAALADNSISLSFRAGADDFGGGLYSLNRNRDQALELLRLALTQPRFDAEPTARIRQRLIAAAERAERDPDAAATQRLMHELFPADPYGRPVDGTATALAAITPADLNDFRARALTRSRLVVGVAGAISARELAAALDRVFGDLAEGASAPQQRVEPDAQGRIIHLRLDAPRAVLAFAQNGPLRDDPDFYAALLVNHILGGGGLTSRLALEIREKRGLAYSTSSFLHPLTAAGLWRGRIGVANDRADETADLLRREWTHMRESGPTAAELADAKAYLTGSYPLRFTSSRRIAGTLAAVQRYGLGIDYIDRRNDLINAVTLQQAAATAKRFLDPDRLTLVIAAGEPTP